jgi:hypothetical protein
MIKFLFILFLISGTSFAVPSTNNTAALKKYIMNIEALAKDVEARAADAESKAQNAEDALLIVQTNLDDANNEYTKFTLGNRNDINDKFQSVVLEYINYRFNFNIKQLNLVTIVKRFMVSNDKKLQYYSKGLNEITGKGTPYRNMFIKCKFITNMLAL